MCLIIFPIITQVRPAEPCIPEWNTSSVIKLSQALKCVAAAEQELPSNESFQTVFEDDDYLLFNRKHFTVQHYAVVLVHENIYLGHIYTWLSSNTCFAMSIRGSIKTPMKGISRYLIEGVRVFALINGCRSVVIPEPIGEMANILQHYGFKQVRSKYMIEGSLGAPYVEPICDYCFELTDLWTQFVSRENLSYKIINA